tara:strand:- start:5448 stop:5867 length:420 start_codon:yes stop_codon:yes gene_type:complete
MACYEGRNGVIKTGPTGSQVAVAQLTGYTITETADTAECTHFDTGGFREYKTTFRSYEVSADMVWNRQDGDLTVGSEVKVEVYPEGDATTTDWVIGNDLTDAASYCIITSMDVTAATEDNVTASVTMQGSGALLRAAEV